MCNFADDTEGANTAGNGTITVTRLNGESFDTPFVPTMTIYSLKKQIEKFMKISPEKQSLMYNQQKLEVNQQLLSLLFSVAKVELLLHVNVKFKSSFYNIFTQVNL